MKRRLPYIALLAAALVGWWVSDHLIVPWIQQVAGYDRIRDRDLDIYDPATRTWSSGPSPFSSFCSLPGIAFQAKLYLVACADDGMLVFDPKTGAWTKAAPRPRAALSTCVRQTRTRWAPKGDRPPESRGSCGL